MSRNILESWPEISSYLDEVLELEPPRRDGWLADLETRAPDAAAAVRAHLVSLDELKAENFMGVAIPEHLTGYSLAGQRFGAYTLERVIGHGGMGTVWLASRSDGRFEGHAAVKLLNTALVGHPSGLRLAREGRMLATLQHPNIAHLLDAGVTQEDQPYLVLEYVRGEPIHLYCETRRLTIRQRIHLFLDVLAAVAHAHSHLIVHRDLKPSNILVTENGLVKLLDFGVAALLSPSAQLATDLKDQLPAGLTLGYAAPEQMLGEPVTIATDIYSLGILLFVLLTGRHPGSTHGELNQAELMRLILERDAPLASSAVTAPRERRQLRGDLDNIVAMALRRLPAERYQTADQFAQDLRRYLAVEPVSARPRSPTYLVAKFARRHRVAVSAAIATLVVMIAAIVISTTEMFEARYQRDQAWYQAQRADASIDFMAQLMRLGPGPGGRPLNFHERLALGVGMVEKQFHDEPRIAARLLVDIADYYRNDGETSRANELYARAQQWATQIGDAELAASAQCSRANADADAAITAGVQARIDDALGALDRIRNPDATVRIGCLLAQAALDQALGKYASTEMSLRRALRIREEIDGSTQSVAYASLLNRLGSLYYLQGRSLEAMQAVRLAGSSYERNGRGRLMAGINNRYTIAIILSDMGEIREALDERTHIKQLLSESGEPGAEHVSFPITRAILLLRMEDPAAALRDLDGVAERARQAGNSRWQAWALIALASADTRASRWEEARAALREVSSVLGNSNDPGTRLAAAMGEAELALAQGDLDAARRHCDEALKFGGYRTQAAHRSLPRVQLLAARIALAAGAASDAERYARESLAVTETKARGPDTSADVGEALLRISQARLAADPAADVRAMLERAVRCFTSGLGPKHSLTVEAEQLLAAQRRHSAA